MSALVIQTSFLGDVVLTTPLIRALALGSAGGPVDVLTTPAGAAVLANNPDIRTLLTYDKRGGGLHEFLRVRRQLRGARKRGAAAYLAQGSPRSALLAAAAGYRTRIGFDSSAGRHLYSTRIPYRDDQHHAVRLLSLASAAESSPLPIVYPSADDVAAVDTLLAGRTAPLVALAPGSAWATKRWPHFGALGRRLAEAGYDVALIAGRDDRAAVEELRRHVPRAALIDASSTFSILGSAELIRRARVLVSNDSLPQHLASAVGTRTLTVFGPTVPAFGFGPLAAGSHGTGLAGLACRPCDRHGPARCPLGHWRCMRDFTADQAYPLLLEMLT